MGACEPGQAGDRAALSGHFHVIGVSLYESLFFISCVSSFVRVVSFFVFPSLDLFRLSLLCLFFAFHTLSV